MNKKASEEIINRLRILIPNPVCELNYTSLYELIVAVVLSAQTTDKRVNEVTKDLFKEYPNPEALMHAEYSHVRDIIGSLGLASMKAKNIIELSRVLHEKYLDIVPNTLEELMKLPGVGRKTASVVLAVGYRIPAMPVDTHLHRMAIRLGYAKKSCSVEEAEEAYKKYIPKEDWIDGHHLLLLFGRYYCKASKPECLGCVVKEYCKYKG